MGIEMTLAEAEGMMSVGGSVRRTAPLPRVLDLWRVQSLQEHACNNVYFQALTVMLQLPGSARYEYVQAPDALEDLSGVERGTVLDLLAAALARLDAAELIEQVRGSELHEGQALPDQFAEQLAARDHNGLLNVVAECLDALIVRPGTAAIEALTPANEWPPWPPRSQRGRRGRRNQRSDAKGDRTMFDEHTQDYLETIAFFQRLPALEMQGVGGGADGQVPQAVADLIRDWRRMQHKDLPEAMREGLARCDDNTLFNVVGHCFDILLRRIVPKYDLRRQRRREKKERRAARQEAEANAALSAALTECAPEPVGASAATSSA